MTLDWVFRDICMSDCRWQSSWLPWSSCSCSGYWWYLLHAIKAESSLGWSSPSCSFSLKQCSISSYPDSINWAHSILPLLLWWKVKTGHSLSDVVQQVLSKAEQLLSLRALLHSRWQRPRCCWPYFLSVCTVDSHGESTSTPGPLRQSWSPGSQSPASFAAFHVCDGLNSSF